MSASIPIRFRPTPRQVIGHAVYVAVMTTAVTAVPIAFLLASPGLMWLYLLLLPVVGLLAGLVVIPLAGRSAVDIDERGVSGGADVASWHRIREIRAERRGTRTVPVIYLDSGQSWRMRVPYDGWLLSSDPSFDQKLCLLRNTWETRHMWRVQS